MNRGGQLVKMATLLILALACVSLLAGCANDAAEARAALRKHADDYLSIAQTSIRIARSHDGTGTAADPVGFKYLNRDGVVVRIKLPSDKQSLSQDGVVEVERDSGAYQVLFTRSLGLLGQGTWLIYYPGVDETALRQGYDEVTPLEPSWYLVSDY